MEESELVERKSIMVIIALNGIQSMEEESILLYKDVT